MVFSKFRFASKILLFLNQVLENNQFLLFDRKIDHQQNVELDAIPPEALKIKLKASKSFDLIIFDLIFNFFLILLLHYYHQK